MAVVSIVLGENHFGGQKSKFRPRPEWFNSNSGSNEELPRPEPLFADEQSDQPESLNFSPYQTYLNAYEMVGLHDGGDGGNKFQRTTSQRQSFSNLCPIKENNVSVTSHEDYNKGWEYRPSYFIETVCVEPYDHKFRFAFSKTSMNRICEQHDNKCIQLRKPQYFTKRRIVPGFNENCWEPTWLMVNSDCQCMWPTDRKGE
jgi:hypothetical protein